MYTRFMIISLLLIIAIILSASNTFSNNAHTKIGAKNALLGFEVKGTWQTKTKTKGKVLKFIANNPKTKLILVYYEDRALPYDPAKALDKFLRKYKFKYLANESLITKTVQGKETKVNILFALGSGFYKREKQIIFARSSLIDNTNVVLITLTLPDKFDKNYPEMKKLLKYTWNDR